MLDLNQIGMKLHHLRKQKGLSQEELAEQLLVSHQAISQWETGKALPSIDNICELIVLYNISLEDVLCLKVNPNLAMEQLFQEHSRAYAIDAVLLGQFRAIQFDDIIHLLSREERMLAIHRIIQRHDHVDVKRLWSRLSYEEQRQFLVAHQKHQIVMPVEEMMDMFNQVERKMI